jgi:hypothetical protein
MPVSIGYVSRITTLFLGTCIFHFLFRKRKDKVTEERKRQAGRTSPGGPIVMRLRFTQAGLTQNWQ